MRRLSKSYMTFQYAFACCLVAPVLVSAQQTMQSNASQPTCAGLLADNPGVSAIGPAADSTRTRADTSARARQDTSRRNRTDTAAFQIGGARTGPPDIILWAAVHADEVRFAKQPQVRVRLCWGGDTLRVVQRENIPSPVVAGTTYRNVYIAVELVGRLNAECLANVIGVRSSAQPPQSGAAAPGGSNANANPPTANANTSVRSASNCAFLGGSAGAGSRTTRPPTP